MVGPFADGGVASDGAETLYAFVATGKHIETKKGETLDRVFDLAGSRESLSNDDCQLRSTLVDEQGNVLANFGFDHPAKPREVDVLFGKSAGFIRPVFATPKVTAIA
jgi:hypothetical protein